jgi:hypothetical protein
MESGRLDVDPADLDAWYNELQARIEGIPRQFIFNIDEGGRALFSERREIKVLVPLDYPDPSIRVPFDRHSKQSTMTACIAADGYRMKPFIVVDLVTAEAELSYFGYDSSNVCFASQENPFMTQRLFDLWAQEVFFPAIEERRGEFRYGGRILVLMDGLGSHHTPAFLDQCTGRGIEVLFQLPNSDQKPLDLLTTALVKQRFAASKFDHLSAPELNRVVRLLGAWFSASAPHHNVEAFMNLGLIPVERSGQFFLEFHAERARRVKRWPVRSTDTEPAPPTDTEPAPPTDTEPAPPTAIGRAFLPQEARRRVRLQRGRE